MLTREWFKERWAALPTAKREQLAKGAMVGALVAVCTALYYARGERPKVAPPKDPVIASQVGDTRMKDDLRSQMQKELNAGAADRRAEDDKIQALQAQVAKDDAQNKALLAQVANVRKGVKLDGVADDSDIIEGDKGGPPAGDTLDKDDLLPKGSGSARNTPPMSAQAWQHSSGPDGAKLEEPKLELVGDIGDLSSPQGTQPGAGLDKDAKKKRTFHLSVGFMPAVLLTGLRAKTVDSAKSDPEPVLVRVQAPAVLPNEVKAQLQGCFVVAHGYGSLASQAYEARTVSLNCLDYKGRAVIEGDITGILADKTGTKGLSGYPVSKMGANMARLFLAGLIQGAGNAFSQSATTTEVSPLGVTQTLNTNQLAGAGIGRGVSQASGELTRVYVDLVHQSAPVIEIGPGKECTVVITQPADLEIKQFDKNQ